MPCGYIGMEIMSLELIFQSRAQHTCIICMEKPVQFSKFRFTGQDGLLVVCVIQLSYPGSLVGTRVFPRKQSVVGSNPNQGR